MYTQSILHLKYCFQQNFIFKNFIFENFIFRKIYQNLFDLILFNFLKKKNSKYCSQLTGQCYCSLYCSYLLFTVLFTVLFTGTVGHNTKNCIATHFQQPLVVLQYNFLSLVVLQYNFLSLVVLQYNFISLVVLQYNFLSMLQYNLTPPAIHFLPNQLHNLAIQSAVLQYNLLYCNTICCIAIQFPILKPSSLQYKNCIAIQSTSLAHPRPLYPNTMPLLQYKNFFSQYNMGSSPKRFSTKKNYALNFFSFFNFNYFFFIYFQKLEKSLKITKNHFFFLGTQINS